ncbi:MAG TPA: Rieske 2Fe-2S domain-containing protein [Thermomicrobiales bacterium]|jgi:nitrite reductase/ring-hydroxylating ferredoxin subunit/uncharacterized membrane protein|nr:Rieske 2Fe-2S domain-containing protein [Thermomicrobiales bacterium]
MPGLLGKLSAASSWLDKPAETIKTAVTPILGEKAPRALKDILYGNWLGHPLHPLLTDVTLGAFTTSMAMDVIGEERASDLSLKLGVISSGATALTGAAQWYDATYHDEPRRLGALHATLNTTALGFYIWSWVLRDQDKRAAGIATAWVGHSIATASGYIGGHLSYVLGMGVDRNIAVNPVEKWKDTGVQESELVPGELRRVDVKGTPVMLLKDGPYIRAASPVCPHLSGPLDKGKLDGTCVECPWHGSVFDLTNGRAVHGPATTALTLFDTQVLNGTIQVRTREEDKG